MDGIGERVRTDHDPGTRPKTLDNRSGESALRAVPDFTVVGDPDMWQLLVKASSESEGWMKSTKAMLCNTGCVVQVTTQQRNADGSYAIAEALCFVPFVVIAADVNGGRRLAPAVE